MTKMRTTPNAWNAALGACADPEVRSWLEAQGQVHPSVVNLDLDPAHHLAAKAVTALQAGNFAGRTKGAVDKIVEALLNGAPVPQAQTEPTGLDLLPPTPAVATTPVMEEPEPEPEPTPTPAILPQVADADAEVDAVLNPQRSIRELMQEYAAKETSK